MIKSTIIALLALTAGTIGLHAEHFKLHDSNRSYYYSYGTIASKKVVVAKSSHVKNKYVKKYYVNPHSHSKFHHYRNKGALSSKHHAPKVYHRSHPKFHDIRKQIHHGRVPHKNKIILRFKLQSKHKKKH